MTSRIVFEVRELQPGYFAYDVTVHPAGLPPSRQASGAFREHAKAELAARLATDAINAHLASLGFAPLPVARVGPSPLRRQLRRITIGAGVMLAIGVWLDVLIYLSWVALSAVR